MKKYPLYFLIIILIAACNTKDFADRIYINATIWTGDSTNKKPGAIAVKDSIILYVGNDYKQLKGKNTEVIDLNEQMIVPGFIDNHTHFLSGGYQLASVNLRTAGTQKDFINILRTFASTAPADRWIQGGDWDHEAWGGELPRKEWIDSVTPHNPVFVSRYDGHMAMANSTALKLAGIDKTTKDPKGGVIVKDPVTGEPTGVLRDEAMTLIFNIIPDPAEKELDESLQRAIREAVKNGVTEVHDMGSYGGWPDLVTYQRAYKNNLLDIRIYSFLPLSDWKKLDLYIKENGRGDNHLRWGGLKGFVDGSLGSTTAWFYKPYLDDPTTSGFTITDTSLLRSWK